MTSLAPASLPPPGGLSFRDVVHLALGHWRTILASIAAALALGLLYIWLAPPVYRSDALIQVETEKQKDPALGEIALLLGGDQTPVIGEMQIIQSRLVLNQVIDELGLEIAAYPQHFPLFGAAIARRADKAAVRKPVFGLSHYAWGGERIGVRRFEVPEGYTEAKFRLTATTGGYRLQGPGGEPVLEGTIGTAATGKLGDATVAIEVEELVARPGTDFVVQRMARGDVIKSIDNHLTIAEDPRASSLFSVVFDCGNPRHCMNVMSALVKAYIRQNIERKSEDNAKTLVFLRNELPEIDRRLRTAAAALAAFLKEHGQVNLDAQTQLVLQQSLALENSKVALVLEKEDLTRRFTDRYPAAAALQSQIDKLEAEQSRFQQQINTMPATYRDYLTYNLELQAQSTLYNGVLSSIQNLELEKAGQVGTVRIIDQPTKPIRPAWPVKIVVMAAALLSGLFIGFLVIAARRALDVGVVDPAQVERELGLATYAAIPYSEEQEGIGRSIRRRQHGEILAHAKPDDIAVESLRSLRTALQFALADAGNNIVALTGPEPGLGKSFVSVNLGAVLASGGARVVVIDGDMRRGHLHSYVSTERAPGLSNFLAGTAGFEQIVRTTGIDRLSLVTTGTIPPNPTELLMSERFLEFLRLASAQFDRVLIDTPPVLAVADAAILGRLSATTLIVLKTGKHPMRIIDESLKRLRQAGVSVKGAVFNQTTRGRPNYGYGYGYGYADVYRYYASGYKYKGLK